MVPSQAFCEAFVKQLQSNRRNFAFVEFEAAGTFRPQRGEVVMKMRFHAVAPHRNTTILEFGGQISSSYFLSIAGNDIYYTDALTLLVKSLCVVKFVASE